MDPRATADSDHGRRGGEAGGSPMTSRLLVIFWLLIFARVAEACSCAPVSVRCWERGAKA